MGVVIDDKHDKILVHMYDFEQFIPLYPSE